MAAAEIQREMVELPNFPNGFAVLVSKGACTYDSRFLGRYLAICQAASDLLHKRQ